MTQTIEFKNRPKIIGSYSVVGPKEGKGPFGEYFDYVMQCDLFGEKTYEKAERKMLEQAVTGAIQKAGLTAGDINLLLAGDLPVPPAIARQVEHILHVAAQTTEPTTTP